MGRGRPKTKNAIKSRQLKTIDRKPIRPLERQRMRPWLVEMLESNDCNQLVWMNKREKIFRVSWKHAAGQTFDPAADATLFERWARHTGKYYDGDRPDPKKWKANFRCALNSLQDVDEDKAQGVRKGNNAFKVYKFLDEKRPKKVPARKERHDERNENDDDDIEDEFEVLRNIGTRSRPKVMPKDEFDSEGSENGSSPPYDGSNHSDWEMTTDDLRRQDHDVEPEKSPLPNFDQLCQSFPNTFSQSAKSVLRTDEPYIPPSPANSDQDEVMSHTSSCPTDEEIVETIQMLRQDQYQEYATALWTSMLEASIMDQADVQEAPEEVVYTVSADNFYEGPNVIVLCEPNDTSHDYEYTSLSEL